MNWLESLQTFKESLCLFARAGYDSISTECWHLKKIDSTFVVKFADLRAPKAKTVMHLILNALNFKDTQRMLGRAMI